MDLNYLYHRHQVSLFNAENAACEQSRLAHLSLVDAYAGKIEQAKRRNTAPPAAGRLTVPISREEAADQLREQAASCRRLAGRARTEKGFWALNTVAKQFDSDALRIDPTSERR